MNKLGEIERFKGREGDSYWRAQATNGNIVADGSEGYRDGRDMEKGRLLALKLLYADATPDERAEALRYAEEVDRGNV